ncbi:hypothetical protein SAMN05877809_103252 [Rhodobacter sp. JA431]|uniref:hypothetical protein n=1 Tax=Rhodobacter sp. JA431 TaxID=570013 RepID=UPI000BC83959|nr:hypothetical protein [Rhodobacter sp. JA431]SOC04670.1 hypothetical protein SAMN05877809_103252 [Rhodobacter sp. JA431]
MTNNPKRRCDELNAGIPPAAKGKWAMRLTSQPFPDMPRAEAARHRASHDIQLKKFLGIEGTISPMI